MARVDKIEADMRANPAGVSFADLLKVCTEYFGQPRNPESSHVVFKMPWPGDPRINIQNKGGKAKPYQVKQALTAIDKLKGELR